MEYLPLGGLDKLNYFQGINSNRSEAMENNKINIIKFATEICYLFDPKANFSNACEDFVIALCALLRPTVEKYKDGYYWEYRLHMKTTKKDIDNYNGKYLWPNYRIESLVNRVSIIELFGLDYGFKESISRQNLIFIGSVIAFCWQSWFQRYYPNLRLHVKLNCDEEKYDINEDSVWITFWNAPPENNYLQEDKEFNFYVVDPLQLVAFPDEKNLPYYEEFLKKEKDLWDRERYPFTQFFGFVNVICNKSFTPTKIDKHLNFDVLVAFCECIYGLVRFDGHTKMEGMRLYQFESFEVDFDIFRQYICDTLGTFWNQRVHMVGRNIFCVHPDLVVEGKFSSSSSILDHF